MKKIIDCLLIGHNEMQFEEYEKTIRKMGDSSPTYRDLKKNIIHYDNKPYHLAEIFNLFCREEASADSFKPLNMLETFSASIAYLGTYLHNRGYSFDYVNSFQDEKERLTEMLEQADYRLIAITTTLYVSAFPIVEIVNFFRQYSPGTKIVVGGPFVSTKYRTQDSFELEYVLKAIDADFYVNSSQGEATLVKIVDGLKNNTPLDQIPNIYYKKNSSYTATPLEQEDNRLEENMVNWDLFADRVGEYAAVRTAISCPFSCSFCGFPEHAGKYQTAHADAVEQELDRLNQIQSLKCVHFIDDTFNLPKERFKDILRRMIKKNYRFNWHSYFRCQYADDETLQLMKESGCDGVFLGIESGSNKILKNMNKAVTIEQYYDGIQLLKKHGIVTFGNFIIGFPGETRETIQETIHFIKTSGLDFYRVQLWYCEPITPIWREKEKYGIEGESFEWKHDTMDSRTACDFIDEIFMAVDNVTWIPQYNFDFDNLWHLTHRGMTLDQVRDFLKAFHSALKEEMTGAYGQDVRFEVIRQLKQAYTGDVSGNKPQEATVDVAEKYDVSFDF